MKKLIFGAAMLTLAISCNTPSTTTSTDKGQAQADKNMANNLKVYDALKSGDTSPLDSLVATDAVDHDGAHGDMKGKDSILHMLGDMHNHFKDLKFDVISSAANGDYVFTLVRISGTTTDSSMGMPGRAIDEKGVDVVKFNSDNKVTDHWGFSDDQQVSKEMKEMRDKMSMKDDSKMKK